MLQVFSINDLPTAFAISMPFAITNMHLRLRHYGLGVFDLLYTRLLEENESDWSIS